MTEDGKSTRGMGRGLLYAMIPLGFILLVVGLIMSGLWTQETTEDAPVVVEEPPAPLED